MVSEKTNQTVKVAAKSFILAFVFTPVILVVLKSAGQGKAYNVSQILIIMIVFMLIWVSIFVIYWSNLKIDQIAVEYRNLIEEYFVLDKQKIELEKIYNLEGGILKRSFDDFFEHRYINQAIGITSKQFHDTYLTPDELRQKIKSELCVIAKRKANLSIELDEK